MATITIETPKGKHEIEATVVGQLAYHPNLRNPKYLTVTHVKSGRIAVDLVFKSAIKKVLDALADFDIDAWHDAGYPEGFFTEDQRRRLVETRNKYTHWVGW